MTEKELQKAKEYILKKNELKNMKQRILELEEDLNVKEYIRLVNSFKIENREKIEVVISDDGSNKILFEYGVFETSIRGSYSCPTHIYIDLETGFYYTHYYHLMDKYDRREGLVFENPKERGKLIAKDCEYNELRDYFFEQLLSKKQKTVVKELLQKNKQLIKVKPIPGYYFSGFMQE